ncbi:MAG TPA: amidohydrolase family protein [Verrucomicrobiae bacterium]|nr:amidohydrolase family protein [Verrucomicrobiae bacterium]HTZ54706.1 amidohydrolase family protein [Candidatus Acidoferrum sp.]
MTASVASLGLFTSAKAAPPPSPRPILFTNFRLFDGTSTGLRDGLFLLVEGTRIKTVGTGTPPTLDGADVIRCGGRVIMPGLIDSHWHAMFAGVSLPALMQGDAGFITLAASADAERTLMRGFTTIRDLGGPSFALKQAIDQGLATGPRIYPCGAMITSSGGHGDMRPLYELPRAPGGPFGSIREAEGAMIVDGPDEVRLRVREQLTQGASQIKLVGSGGVSSPRSPLDATTLTEAEMRAAVEVCSDWNTFATVHAYIPKAIQRAVAAGAKCIEHGHLMDDATAATMAEHGVWLSMQPFLTEEDQLPQSGEARGKIAQVFAGTSNTYKLAIKHGIKTAFGSDLLFSQTLAQRQGVMLTHLTQWYTNVQILKQATASNAELLSLSGPRNPYPGKLGVVEDGAFADLLLVDGNPLDDISLVAKPEKSFVIIMKDGTIFKNTLA